MCAGYSFSSRSVLVKAQQARGCSTTTTNIQIWNINQTTKVTCICCSVTDCVLSEYCVLSGTVERVTAGPEDGSSI